LSLFSRKPKLHSCFFCSEQVEYPTKDAHYRTHLIEVTDNNGQQAFTFKCPRCGLMDQAWGGGRPNPEFNGVNAIYVHLMQSHNLDLIA
jgi:hypothetical protein